MDTPVTAINVAFMKDHPAAEFLAQSPPMPK
jgi:hypothetical protein